ncbi:hypothetical protein [Streptomyces xinghaiensis]|uniref:hypothetical protein n=1 Tax=Streptomyces xinghaiensis TaxID=1038928 RepID=UPI003C2CE16C
MRRRIAAAVTGAMALSVLGAPAARADLSSPAVITGGSVNSGRDLVLGPDSRTTFEVSFTARDDSGISADHAEVNLLGPNGHRLQADPVSRPVCAPVSSTTSTCRFTVTVDTGSARIDNSWAGTWRLWALAVPNDWNPATGEGLVTRSGFASVRIKRKSTLTMDAAPEPVAAGRPLAILGALRFADWGNGGYTGSAGHPVRVVFASPSSPLYRYVKDLETGANGWVLATVLPDEDDSWWLAYNGTESTSWVYSADDYVDVR